MHKSICALREDIRQAVVYDFAAGRADDIADEQDFQWKGSLSTGVRVSPNRRSRHLTYRWQKPEYGAVHFAVRC